MRNIFDQYNQPENRLTHALVSCLAGDPRLLRKFVRWATGDSVPAGRRLEVLEQRLPGQEEVADEAEAERRGLPDAWIHDGKGWALIIESKIESPLKRDQLDRHRRVAERRECSDVHLLALVTERPKKFFMDGLAIREWRELYSWLRRERRSEWARRMTEYMEVVERKLAAEEYLRKGTLTVFTGIPFGNDYPYNYGEAKRLLRLCLEELKRQNDLRRRLGMDPQGKGRPAITGKETTSVWDFLPLMQARRESYFTKCPHLTLSIQLSRLFACVTIPNGIKREYRRNLLSGGRERFFIVVREVQANLEVALRKVDGAAPWVDLIQRHYPSQRSTPITDARLEFDLRTDYGASVRSRRRKTAVKTQPQWLEAAYQALLAKRANLQLTIGAIFPYSRCEAVHTPEILNHVAGVWLACRPLTRAVFH